MAKHRHEEHEEHVDESWLIPYADLLTLLLALFIVLFATSNIDKQKYDAMAAAFHGEIIEGGGMSFFAQSTSTAGGVSVPEDAEELAEAIEQQELQSLQKALQAYLDETGLQDDVSTQIDSRGLVISMNNALLFDSGSAMIKPEYQGMLVKIGETIDRLDNTIRVEGHTDTVPTNSAQYPTNWELSSARATSVVRLFQDSAMINPHKLEAVGYGEYQPVADNSTPEGRNKNRRVDIILLSNKYDTLEGQHGQE